MPASRDEERVLWRSNRVECVMISCCSGAELQIRRRGLPPSSDEADIVLRELYPTKSDLYERANALRTEFGPTEEA
jgi:hypothetical protein